MALLTAILAIGLAIPAVARLGETREQLIERYGEPLREAKPELPASDSAAVFSKDMVDVHVELKDGKAWMVIYSTRKPMTPELQVQFRDANDGVDGLGEWKEPVEHLGRTYWTTDERDQYGVFYSLGNLHISRFCTAKCLAASIEARRLQIDKAITGDLDTEAGVESPALEVEADGDGDGDEEKEASPF